MSQGAWQQWEDKEYLDFLARYYGMQFLNAKNILKSAMQEESEALLITVFNKIASPSVYLQPHYKKRKGKTNGIKIAEQPPTPPKTEDRWKPTKTEGTEWMSERDATEEEMIRAMDPNSKDTWYMKPREGYQYGAIFRKVNE